MRHILLDPPHKSRITQGERRQDRNILRTKLLSVFKTFALEYDVDTDTDTESQGQQKSPLKLVPELLSKETASR